MGVDLAYNLHSGFGNWFPGRVRWCSSTTKSPSAETCGFTPSKQGSMAEREDRLIEVIAVIEVMQSRDDSSCARLSQWLSTYITLRTYFTFWVDG